MKIPFVIFKNRPVLTVSLTRDSVCAGDDCDAPHESSINVPSFADPVAFARAVSQGYLPSVAGFGHSWICLLNGKKIAEIKILNPTTPLVDELIFEEENAVHFIYNSSSY